MSFIDDMMGSPDDVPENETDRLLYVLDGWLGQDDWSMPTYPYPKTVKELLDCLRAGDNPWALRRIGKVTPSSHPKTYAALSRACPAYTLHEAKERASYRAGRS